MDQRYFRRVDGAWLPCRSEQLKEVPSSELPPNGVVLLNLKLNKVKAEE